MKEDQKSIHNNNNINHPIKKSKQTKIIITKLFTSPLVYFLLLLLSYAFGYMSAPTTTQPPPTTASSTLLQLTTKLPNKIDNFRVATHCNNPLQTTQLLKQMILDRVFNSVSPYDNFPPPHVAGLLGNKRVKGWGSYGAVFQHLIEKVKPKVIIEVGTFLGASALHMNELTRKLGLDSLILCVDDFRGWPGFRDQFKYVKMVNGDVLLLYQFMQNVIYNNATGSILPIPFSTGSVLDKFCEWGVFGDLIEIDAGHDFNSAWADINRAYQILKPGGVMFGHDYFTAADNRGVRRAVNLFAEINGFKILIDGQHWIIDSSSS